MKAVTCLLVGLLVFFSVAIFFMHSAFSAPSTSYESDVREQHKTLMELISHHNDTINDLMMKQSFRTKGGDEIVSVLRGKDSEISSLASAVTEHQQLLTEKDSEIARLKDLLADSAPSRDGPTHPSASAGSDAAAPSFHAPMTTMEASCDDRYGNGLLHKWTDAKESWCDAPDDSDTAGSLECYPYLQEHKRIDGRGADIFCEAKNIFIDFSKISIRSGADKHSRYHKFAPGSTFSTCQKTSKYGKTKFMNHNQLQMSHFSAGRPAPTQGSYTVVDTPTYLLARDEDCENSFHSTADFMNMYLVMNILGLTAEEMQVILFDSHADGPYIDLIRKAFSPNHPVLRAAAYKSSTVLFKRVVFHLESPAGVIFPRVANPDPMRCVNTALFDGYRRSILQAFDLLDISPPPIPSVVLSLRHRTATKNVGRVMANEEEVVNVLKEGNMMNYRVVDTATMSYYEQLKMIRSANVLVGVHGAGLMFIMFAADEAVLVEIHPTYRQDRHFRHASRVTGKNYMPLRAQQRETCKGSSDNVMVPINEFRATLDGAIRLARGFDDGLSECGLKCDPSILALDRRLDPHYASTGTTKGRAVNTVFPCH